ncbi:MAG: hypothetical protein ACLFR0_06535 [Alphaproteobacteria bacterium]
MLRDQINTKPVFFIANEGRNGGNGGGDDPFDRDEELAMIFKKTLNLAIIRKMSTPNPFGIGDIVEDIVERANNAGPSLILMANSLRPIAKTLINIPSPSDRVNLGRLEMEFKDFDLSVEP